MKQQAKRSESRRDYRGVTTGGVLLLCSVAALSLGCQQKVVGRSGIGAEETNPTLSEKEKTDVLSDFIWKDQNKN